MVTIVRVQKDTQVSEVSIDNETILEFKAKGVDIVEDTKASLLRLVDLKVRNARGNTASIPVFTVNGI
jgi:hypothetical protein